jgi:DNA-binding HxlR family transcriptional regulator
MARETFDKATNPYHYALHCLGGKWKMTILHEIHTYGVIHFNKTLKVLPISEKVLSEQLKELIQDGLVKRIVNSDTFPPSTDYVLTKAGKELIPFLDVLYIWSIRQMDSKGIPIDADAFVVHQTEKYLSELGDIMDANQFEPEMDRTYSRKKINKNYW